MIIVNELIFLSIVVLFLILFHKFWFCPVEIGLGKLARDHRINGLLTFIDFVRTVSLRVALAAPGRHAGFRDAHCKHSRAALVPSSANTTPTRDRLDIGKGHLANCRHSQNNNQANLHLCVCANLLSAFCNIN